MMFGPNDTDLVIGVDRPFIDGPRDYIRDGSKVR